VLGGNINQTNSLLILGHGAHIPWNQWKTPFSTILKPQACPQNMLKPLKLGLARELTRYIVNMRSLKNTTNDAQLPCKGEILVVTNMKLSLNLLKTKIPHRY
jgi:hypothetical protein